MIFNFTDNYQFATRMPLKNENLETVKESKLLGVIISDDLKWNQNTNYLIKKAYKRMELLRKASHFTVSKLDRKIIYTLYIRSVLEQSCVVWHSSLTQENSDDLERVQKAAVKIILGNQYKNDYEEALEKADLETLKERRIKLCLKFAKKCLQYEKTEDIFEKRLKKHKMKTKNSETFRVNHALTDRLRNSAIP